MTAPAENLMQASQPTPVQEQISKPVHADEHHHGSFRVKIRSAFLLALAIFIASNAACSFFTPIRFDPYKYTYRGWSWWAIDDLRNSGEVRNVALLGSSLMVSAVAGCDA